MLTLLTACMISHFGFAFCSKPTTTRTIFAWIALVIMIIVWLVFAGHLQPVQVTIP